MTNKSLERTVEEYVVRDNVDRPKPTYGHEFTPDASVVSRTMEEQTHMMEEANGHSLDSGMLWDSGKKNSRTEVFNSIRDMLDSGWANINDDGTDAYKRFFEMDLFKEYMGYMLGDLDRTASACDENSLRKLNGFFKVKYGSIENKFARKIELDSDTNLDSKNERYFNFGLMVDYHRLTFAMNRYQNLMFLVYEGKYSIDTLKTEISKRFERVSQVLDAIKVHFKNELDIDPDEFKYEGNLK